MAQDRTFGIRPKQLASFITGSLGTSLALAALQLTALAGTDIDWNEIRNGSGPVVFLVNGFGGCNPCISRGLHNKLKAHGIAVFDFDWNDIYRRTQQSNLNLNDALFLDQMRQVIDYVPQSRQIVIIGHSFGGDSALKVSQRTSRRVELLGVLDAVELGGIRSGRSVRENVGYFYNRWTSNPSIGIPLNSGTSGSVSCSASTCDQKEQSFGYNADGSAKRDNCGRFEFTCPGYQPWPGGSNGTKHRRITHGRDNAIYNDELIQEQLFQKIYQLSRSNQQSPGTTPETKWSGVLRNQWSGKCLQTMGQENSNGSNVNIWDCTNTTNQVWTYMPNGELRNQWSGKCLQTMGQENTNGSNANIWDCTNTTNQMWQRMHNGEFRNQWSGKCLQTMGQEHANGSNVNIWECTSTNNQQWR